MPKPLRRILSVFVLIGMLPIGYVAYELSMMNENEKIINDIYANQLDALLFSVNQYSSDIITSWTNQLSSIQKNVAFNEEDKQAQIMTMISAIASIKYAYFRGLEDQENLYHEESLDPSMEIDIRQIISEENPSIKRLTRYYKAGYNRIEALDSSKTAGLLPLLFITDSAKNTSAFGLILLDTEAFIHSELKPKMQSIASDNFVISVLKIADQSISYSTDPSASKTKKVDEKIRSLWLLPEYELAISPKDISIGQIVKKRSQNNLIMLAAILLILSGGLIFLFINIKKEISLSIAKSEFVSNVSHELRTPLSLINLFVETMEMGRAQTEEKKKEYLSIIKKETTRLERIVNGILSFSQMDARKRTYQLEKLDLNELCKEIYTDYQPHLEQNGFSSRLIVEDSQISIQGDKQALSEVIINILDNAIKYSKETKDIEIKTERNNYASVIKISDKGVGIPGKYQKDIFQEFFRTPSENVHDAKGSGLGLAIVKRIMEAHHGKATVESTVGKGSTFQLLFLTT